MRRSPSPPAVIALHCLRTPLLAKHDAAAGAPPLSPARVTFTQSETVACARHTPAGIASRGITSRLRGRRPWRDQSEESDLPYVERVVDSVIQGLGVLDCPVEICYNTSIPGIPPPYEGDRPKCCLAHQTKYPSQFEVEHKSGESYADANDMSASAPSDTRLSSVPAPLLSESPTRPTSTSPPSRARPPIARSWNPGCVDILDFPAYYRNLAAAAVATTIPTGHNDKTPCGGHCPVEVNWCRPDGTCHYPSCADVSIYCDEDSIIGVRARQVCPHTCGCDSPRSDLALYLESYGCPKRCTKTEVYKNALAT